MNRIPMLVLTGALLASSLDAQGRGRFRRGGEGEQATPPPAAAPTPPADSKPKSYTAIVGGDVYLGTGQRMTGATVLIGDARIVGVGHDLELPQGTKIIDAKGKTVSPGFVIVAAGGMGSGRGAPFVDSCNPFDPEIKQGLAAGITSFLAGGASGGNTPGGDNAVQKLAWGDLEGMVLGEGTVYGMSVPLGPGDWSSLEEKVKQAKDHLKARDEFTQKKATDPNAKPPQPPAGSERLLKVLEGKSRLWVSLGGGGGGGRRGRGGGGGSANDEDAIAQACRLATLFGHGVVLNQPISAWLCADDIAATGSMVVLAPRNRQDPDPADPERTGTNLAAAAILSAAGVPVAVTTPSGMFGGGGVGTGGILGQDLNTPFVDAAFAVRGGMDNAKALRTITLDAAKILGVDQRVGSIEAGKDADILILDGDPLHYRTFVLTALVNGKVVYEKDKEPLYSHIQR